MAEIGATLRDARIRARIDMSEVESETKIRAKYLRAIENEEWDLLPGPVYVCLVQGNGKPLIFEQTFAPGQAIPTFTRHKLLLTLGNASVQMKVNGKPVSVAESSNAIRFLLTATSVQQIPMTQTPTCP